MTNSITLNCVAIRKNGSTITAQASTTLDAERMLREWIADEFYNTKKNPIVRFFMGIQDSQENLVEVKLFQNSDHVTTF